MKEMELYIYGNDIILKYCSYLNIVVAKEGYMIVSSG